MSPSKTVPTAFAAATLMALLAAPQARAQSPAQPTTTQPTAAQPASPQPASPQPSEPGFATNLWTRSTLLGDVGGFRTKLGSIGLSVGLQDTNEVLGNVTGGIHTGAAYDGLTMLSVGLDTQAAFGWDGGTFNVSGFNIRGRNLSTDNLLSLQTASGIEAQATTRLWELWFQQSFLDGKADVKLGQISLDTEFMTSQGSSTFINTVMGWPMIPSADLHAGGPAYPLSSLGIRFRARPTENLTLLAAVTEDNPPGGSFLLGNSQLRGAERTGTLFNIGGGALFIAEVQYAINQPSNGQLANPNDKPSGLPGLYKLGFWYDTGTFYSQQFDNTGLSLASPNSTGMPAALRHNFSIYGVMDQTIWQPDPEGPRAVGIFARLMGAPGDRNLINFSVNAGVTLKAPLPTRDDDTFGVGFGVAKVSPSVGAFDAATNFFGGTFGPIRTSETFVEVTYQFQPTPWWLLQPDFQYVFTPGGGIVNPNNPSKSVGNEAVFGLRSVVTF